MFNSLIKVNSKRIQLFNIFSNNLSTNTYYMSIFGKDRTGIVKDISKNIVSLNGNIENSLMSVLGNHFTVMLKASFPININKEYIYNNLDNNLKQKKLSLCLHNGENNSTNDDIFNKRRYTIYGTLHDDKGIVLDLSKILEKHNVYIEKLKSKKTTAPIAGYQIFDFKTTIEISKNNFIKMKNELEKMENKYGGFITIDDEPYKKISNKKRKQENLAGV